MGMVKMVNGKITTSRTMYTVNCESVHIRGIILTKLTILAEHTVIY